MENAAFRSRAIHEGLRYGLGSLVFVREFCQNSRDARADHISIRTRYSMGDMILTFADDGTGMDATQAERFLFTLYASSKEKEPRSAGHFGVGFWSVLLFKPAQITITSQTKKGSRFRAELSGDLTECRLVTPQSQLPGHGTPGHGTGTCIELRKPLSGPEEYNRLCSNARRSLKKYCRYLRKKQAANEPLPIRFNGEILNESFHAGGEDSMSFRLGSIEGAIGLGKKPRVEVYARGLLVWQGTVLEELKYGAGRIHPPVHPEGLSPVYILNGNDLNVTLDRKAVIDDARLARLRRVARHKMRTLLNHYLRSATRQSVVKRLWYWLTDLVFELRVHRGAAAAIVLGAVLILLLYLSPFDGAFFAKIHPGGSASAPVFSAAGENGPGARPPRGKIPEQEGSLFHAHSEEEGPPSPQPLGNFGLFTGPTIDPIGRETQIPFRYDPPLPLFFRGQTFETLSAGQGIEPTVPRPTGRPEAVSCPEEESVRIGVDVEVLPGPLVLPAPTGYAVNPQSIRLDRRIPRDVRLTRSRDTVISFARKSAGTLTYRVCPVSPPLSRGRRSSLLALPREIQLPAALTARLNEGDTKTVSHTVKRAGRLLGQRLKYDRSPAAAAGYQRFIDRKQKTGWFTFVLSYGRGDCDVVNTVYVALLRKLGIPARLAVGLVGRNGSAEPGRHAWVEYHDHGRWQVADATPILERNNEEPVAALSPPDTRLDTDPGPSDPRGRVSREKTPVSYRDTLAQALSKLPVPPISRSWTTVLLLVPAVFFTVVFLSRLKKNESFTRSQVDGRGLAAQILIGVLEQPAAWKGRANLSAVKLLPVFGRAKKLSLRDALRRAREGKLWHSDGQSPLSKKVKHRARCLLDSSDNRFAKLIRRIPGIQDLDEVGNILRSPAERGRALDREQQELIDKMNRIIADSGLPPEMIVPCPGLRTRSRDVDLQGLGTSRRLGQSTLFVGLGIDHSRLRHWRQMQQQQPGKGVYFALDQLTSESRLLLPYRREILRRAARDIFEVTE